jgi:hypothetical protein
MDTSFRQQAARLHCYECGSQTIAALCHHCWRAGCEKHIRSSPHWVVLLLGAEGTGAGLKRVRPSHCADCAHHRISRWLTLGVAGVAIIVVGLAALPVTLALGLVLAIAGGTTAAWAYQRLRHGSAQARAGLPVALHPKVADTKLTEHLRVRITLDSRGDYRTQLDTVRGELRTLITFGRADRDRVDRRLNPRTWSNLIRFHRPQHGPPGHGQDLRFTAGRLVLQGPMGIRASSDIPGAAIPLDGDIHHHPVFKPEDAPASSPWKIRLPYELSSEPKMRTGPFWITPSIVPESNKHVLELDIQWVDFGPDKENPLTLDVIRLLRLRFPVAWGHAQQVSHTAVKGPARGGAAEGQGLQSLEWRQLSPTEEERQDRRFTITVQFQHQIASGDELTGDLEAVMKGTLSGVESMSLYTALGTRRAYAGSAKTTEVKAAFTLSLASVRYQDVRVVPDRALEDSDRSSLVNEFPIVPDDETVIALTNAMSRENYYVKRVIENPPRSGGRANRVQRYWDIAGRSYQGIYPVNFHVILIGEEDHRGDIRPEAGSTKVRIVVSGAYTDGDDDRYAHIETVWNQLRTLTEETLKRQAAAGHEPGPS